MLLYYKDFIQEGRENNINVPNNIDNLSTIKTDTDFKKANKIPAPEVNSDIEPVQVMDFEEFTKTQSDNPKDNINKFDQNKINFSQYHDK